MKKLTKRNYRTRNSVETFASCAVSCWDYCEPNVTYVMAVTSENVYRAIRDAI